jgi:hypothetical protein
LARTILVDAAVWVDRRRAGDKGIAGLRVAELLTRRFVFEKLGLGDLRQRDLMLCAMSNLLGANIK